MKLAKEIEASFLICFVCLEVVGVERERVRMPSFGSVFKHLMAAGEGLKGWDCFAELGANPVGVTGS